MSRVLRFSAVLTALSLGVAQAEPARVSGEEFPTEQKALIEATLAFFDTVESKKMRRKRTPIIGLPLTVTRSRARPNDAAALTRMGPVDHLTGYRITWYPMDRLLGTVDFMGTWDGNKNLVCGYLTWDVSNPDKPVLQSLSASFVDVGDLSKASELETRQSLLSANCAFGEVEQNYRIFDPTG
ncbi:MAG: hypothetical protein QNJ20_14800 [Paracoccaceae bacterium]|nr:hypothetical protein [Paracoccaceae bacterium]